MIAQIDELGNETDFQYDADGRQTVVTRRPGRRDHDDATTRPAEASRRPTRSGIRPVRLRRRGRLTETDFADGTTTTTTYDALGRSIAQTDQLGRVTQYEYDALGRLTAVIDALDQTTSYGYDEAGDLVTQTDANGHVTTYEYDGLGRRIATVLPMGQRSTTTTTLWATSPARPTTTVRRSPTTTTSTTASWPSTSPTAPRPRTPIHRPASVPGDRLPRRDDLCLDALDRLVSRTDPDGTTISYTYDAAGNRTSVTIPAGTTHTPSTRWTVRPP